MAFALHAPRVNNNDDIVQVIAFRVGVGDIIPADALVLEASAFSANEAALTGESLPASKRAGDPGAEARDLAGAVDL